MKICSNYPGSHDQDGRMPIYGKNLKKSSLEPKAYDLETWDVALGAQVLPNDDPGLTLTCFTARSNLVPYA